MKEKVSVRDAATYLGVSTETLRRWSREGLEGVPVMRRLGRRNAFFYKGELEQFALGRPVHPHQDTAEGAAS